jgi:hypothetical protein
MQGKAWWQGSGQNDQTPAQMILLSMMVGWTLL